MTYYDTQADILLNIACTVAGPNGNQPWTAWPSFSQNAGARGVTRTTLGRIMFSVESAL